MDLVKQNCIPCRGGEPALGPAQIRELLREVPAWEFLRRDGVDILERSFRFRDFAGALAFTARVGAEAEAEGHHPSLLTEWGRVKVSWWTHKIKGLHRNDFIMAARTDRLYASAAGTVDPGGAAPEASSLG
jgi:4a-hydroxytetrahydrobiopterin dehydratase